jgi:hypothetical protein
MGEEDRRRKREMENGERKREIKIGRGVIKSFSLFYAFGSTYHELMASHMMSKNSSSASPMIGRYREGLISQPLPNNI